jgi:hypothetical protein
MTDAVYQKVETLLSCMVVIEHSHARQCQDCINKKKSAASGIARKAVEALFLTVEYINQPDKISKYVVHALSKHGPALWGDPVAEGVTQDMPEFVVSSSTSTKPCVPAEMTRTIIRNQLKFSSRATSSKSSSLSFAHGQSLPSS